MPRARASICSWKPIQTPLRSSGRLWLLVPGASSPPGKNWGYPGNQKSCAKISLDTNLTNFSLSTLVFNYLLLLDSTSLCRKSDKKIIIIQKLCYRSKHLCVTAQKQNACSHPEVRMMITAFLNTWGKKMPLHMRHWFRELAPSSLGNALLVLLPGASSCLKRFEALRLLC